MFPRQETPSPSCTLYLFACSPIFIRLYLRLESVPLHFLLRSSSSSSRRHCLQPPPPSRHSTFSPPGTDAVTTTCKHSGICNSNAAKRGRKAATEQPEAVRLTSRRRSRDYELAILLTARIRVVAETAIVGVFGAIGPPFITAEMSADVSAVAYYFTNSKPMKNEAVP
ncbi:Uncharacterized protein DBV15_08581 [Temnothorax longispinosus]|uniref:Uncharacterized protein n=1 Tax=Temnothorax longispinosus TaxID=300112 RepID=A0A4S2KZ69_9HYME|nr:Uncharacterized protein DBV15_08581 [Temnothorax longispinosus]